MPLTIYRQADADMSPLAGKTVAVLGYGNQGRAHALNLRDSGIPLVIGQRQGKSADRAQADGFTPLSLRAAAAAGDLLILSLPDEWAASIYTEELAAAVAPGKTLGFVHGFNIHYGFIAPPPTVDVIMIAPKGPGTLLRSMYVDGRGIPALLALHQDATGRARATALAWAAAIGCTRAAVVETTFASETETDLFGEQVVLCGGITALTKAAFETLVAAGYEPEFAYLECVHELKQIADLLYARGLTGMREAISNTAEYGDLTRGPRIVSEEVRQEMRRILDEVRSGAFAREWIEECRAGGQRFRRLHQADADTAYEAAGETVRSWMPWLAASTAHVKINGLPRTDSHPS